MEAVRQRSGPTRGTRGHGHRRFAALAALLVVSTGVVFAGCGVGPADNAVPSSVTTTARATTTTTTGRTDMPHGVTEAIESTTTITIGELGGRRNPIPLGREAEVGGWKIAVTGVLINATKAILDENIFNEKPEDGTQYAMVKVDATYAGDGTSTFWVDLTYSLVDDTGETFESRMTAAPDSIIETDDVEKGQSVTGNLVFIIPSSEEGSMTVMFRGSFSAGQPPLYFALK